MKKNLVLLIPLLLSLCGCTTILLNLSGMRQPKEETLNDIKKCAAEWDQDTNQMYVLKDSSAYIRMHTVPPYKEVFANALIYSKNGKIKHFRDSSACQWSTARSLAKMKPDTAYEVIPVSDWDLIFQDIVPLAEGGGPPSFDTSRYDFLVIYTWAVFMHKYNERQFQISKAAAENPYARIKVIQVNMDIQESWHLSKDNWVHFRVNK